jgi:hypothetical protein
VILELIGIQGAYPGLPPGQIIETNNTLTHPAGPEYQLVVGEGKFWRKQS